MTLKSGRFGRFVQLGEGEKPKRASLPRDVAEDSLDLALALKLLSLPREVGLHPETGKPITASIGRFGPYLAHDGQYAKLNGTAEVFETGMNMAVAKLAEPKGFARRAPVEPLRVVGQTEAGADIRLMAGRYGPYVSDGTTNASLAKGADPAALSLEEARALLAARAAAAPAKARKPVKKAAAKKPAAKKAAAKKKAAP